MLKPRRARKAKTHALSQMSQPQKGQEFSTSPSPEIPNREAQVQALTSELTSCAPRTLSPNPKTNSQICTLEAETTKPLSRNSQSLVSPQAPTPKKTKIDEVLQLLRPVFRAALCRRVACSGTRPSPLWLQV